MRGSAAPDDWLYGIHQTGEPLRTFSAASLADTAVPPRAWHVEQLIPAGTVTTLNGDGGTGKSIIALQLAAATALGRPWLGQQVAEGPALFLTAEDDRAEVHRRLVAVARSLSADLADLERLTLLTLAGEDAILAQPAPGSPVLAPTGLYKQLGTWIGAHGPRLVVFDTLADLFGGQENDRGHARQFIGLMRGLAIRHQTTVLLLAHPSLSGLSTGTGNSGSTAWNNSVRSRLYLRRITDEGHEPDPDVRTLSTVKANYAPTGGEIRVRWADGVFAAEEGQSGVDRMAASAKAERVFLALVRAYDAEGRRVSPHPSSSYAPTVFSADPRAEGVTKRAMVGAMNALFQKGRIKVVQEGPKSKMRDRIAEVAE